MNLAFSIARRYLFAKKSQNVINVISLISMVGVLTASMALLVVLSVFNGLHDFVGNLYGNFDPDLKVVPSEGKVISLDSINLEDIKNIDGIELVSETLENQALLKFDKRRAPAMVLGVDSTFNKISSIDSIIVDGEFKLHHKNSNLGVIGGLLADQLALRLNFVTPLVMYVPKRTGSINMMAPQNAFRKEYINPSGIFMVQQPEYDSQYLIIGIDQARRLFEYDSNIISSLYVKVTNPDLTDKVKKEIEKISGSKLKPLNREEQHQAFYKVMRVEKLMAYLILSFILAIAAFNVIGTMSMLIFEKKESIFTLKSMGGDRKLITRIFLVEGLLISLLGVIIGLVLGIVLVLLQQHVGLIKFSGGGSFLVDAYPVQLVWSDVFLVLVTVCIIGYLAAWYPVKVIVKRYYSETGMP
ncbi:FtsX-like permease family protein [Carboxylicivirga linearis]|uniref:ABC transporter permease n=1 Tax=Carboxylicivirga linearis TaxID=1628157 RepID=A0ABS5JTU7_9BACT|nr:FtsX-like permease family protein [Carboxylicivirga linearis]MBS2098312.1 ABC transporter permease [Carboxylicivirga linearis]